jgi:hypothetical protein
VPVSISTRYSDADGEPLFTSFGDGPPPSWGGGEKVTEKRFDTPPTTEWLEERARLFLVVQHAGEALAKANLGDPRMEPERRDLVNISRHIVGNDVERDDHPEASLERPVVTGGAPTTTADVPQDYNNGATYYREKFQIRTVDLHICTRWKAQYYKSGIWYTYTTIDNKDHGEDDCYADAPIVRCTVATPTRSSTSSMRTTMRFCDNGEGCNNSSGDVGECKGTGTYYSEYCLVRVNPFAGGECHNCKRDAWVQKNWVLDRYDSRGGGACWWDSIGDPNCNDRATVTW